MTVVLLTSASTSPWTRPGDWTDAGHTVNLVGCGGRGGPATTGTSYRSGSGGGGGGHGLFTYSSGALASTTLFAVKIDSTSATSGTDATYWQNTSAVSPYQRALAGQVGATATSGGSAGAGTTQTGTGAVVYTLSQNFFGGVGGNTAAVAAGAGGGGGAGGPSGAGGNGGSCTSASFGGGGGGAGNGGAAASNASKC